MTARTLHAPHRYIGAQELLNIAPNTHSGFLSKRGRRERIVERFNLPKKSFFNDIKKWRKRFVIVSQGCVYIFDSTNARRSHQAFPLAGYNQLCKMGSENEDYVFRLEGRYDGMKEYHFSCPSDNDRKEWMSKLREEMCVANDKHNQTKSISLLSDDDAYVYLQTPVFREEDADSHNSDFDEEDDDNYSDDYTKIPDHMVSSHRPLPATPLERLQDLKVKQDIQSTAVNQRIEEKRVPPILKEENNQKSNLTALKPPKSKALDIRSTPVSRRKDEKRVPPIPKEENNSKPKNDKPKKPPKPEDKVDYINSLTEKDYLFDSHNREKAERILKQGPSGVFLVRNSRTDDSKVLAVKSGREEIREYKLFKQGNQVSLDRKQFFNSTHDLVQNFTRTNLPNRDMTLGKAYSSLDLSAF